MESYDEAFGRYELLVNKFFPDEKVRLPDLRIAGQRFNKISFELIDLKKENASETAFSQKHKEFEEAENDLQQTIDAALAAEYIEFAERTATVGITIDSARKTIIFASSLTIIRSILVGIYIAYTLTRPILQVKDAAIEIGKGKLETRVSIKSRDEVGILAACFNQMAENLQNAGEKLRESEGKFHTLYETSSDAIMLLDEKRFFDCNNATLLMFGFSKKEDFIKVHPAEVSPPYQPDGVDSMTAANKRIAEAYDKGTNFFEWMHRRQNGEDFPADVLLTRFQLGEKQVLQATVRDLTERWRSERLLKSRLFLSEYALVHSEMELLQVTLDEAEKLTGSSIGFFHYVDEKQETLHLQAWSTNTLATMCAAQGRDKHYPISEAGVWVDCVREKMPVIHNDYESIPHKKGLPEGHAPLVRELVVPVIRNEKVLAIAEAPHNVHSRA